ncbi:response regulator (plasmid) [Kovacikia minuta CCNUW1]|uniref:response regulator n=1 Tax=Kovacikia minuta TaxID=2931930 RepID=UPI001CCEB020|nr:response regulator [Kovacikia minuta]UBF30422.1 response regulator [Kovacikia minuta CCNUW1]
MHQSSSLPAKQTFLVVDDHESVLSGTLNILSQAYPDAEMMTAQNFQDALQKADQTPLDLVVVDLVMPENAGEAAHSHAGIQLLETLMKRYPTLNIVVQSSHVRTLVWLKPAIDKHQGGFTVVDKGQPIKELLMMVDWALRERTYTPKEIRNGLQLRPEWLEVLRLGCQEGLQDEAIAKRMHVHEKSVQNYWAKIRDILEIYPNEEQNKDKNIRILTTLRAREVGLID